MEIGDICLLFVYMYIYIVCETSLNGLDIMYVGGVKCHPFLKQ